MHQETEVKPAVPLHICHILYAIRKRKHLYMIGAPACRGRDGSASHERRPRKLRSGSQNHRRCWQVPTQRPTKARQSGASGVTFLPAGVFDGSSELEGKPVQGRRTIECVAEVDRDVNLSPQKTHRVRRRKQRDPRRPNALSWQHASRVRSIVTTARSQCMTSWRMCKIADR